jgi:rhamnosyl/mannosyltransferase
MIVHEPNPWALVSLLVARSRIPYAIWFHSAVIRPRLQYRLFYAPIARPIYDGARRFVVSSPALAERSAALQPYRDRISVIPFGVDVEPWQSTAAIQLRVAQLRRAAGRPMVLFVGRLVPYKGVDVLIKAVSALPVHLVIAGDGPMRGAWEQLANEQRGRGTVEFAGAVADGELKALMHAAAVFALPSVTAAEAFGLVQLEAMACSTPVVSADVASGVPWVNRDGVTGIVVPPGDVAALRCAIERLVGDAPLSARLGAAGLARARGEFSMPAMADRLVELCDRVAGDAA